MQIDSYFISDLFIYLFSHSNFDRNKDQFCDSIAININFCLINFCLISNSKKKNWKKAYSQVKENTKFKENTKLDLHFSTL